MVLTTNQLTTLHLIAEGRGFDGYMARQRAASGLRHRAAAELLQRGLIAEGPSASGYVLLPAGTDAIIQWTLTPDRRTVREPAGDQRVVTATAEEFFETIERVMGPHNPISVFVTHYSLTDLRAMSARYLARTGLGGIAVHDHGDGRIEGTALFNAGKDGMGRVLLEYAMEHAGVNYLECLDDGLRVLYEKVGFSVESTTPFNPDYAPPGWDEVKFGRPNYYTLVREPMEFMKPKTAEERKIAMTELNDAKPDEVRRALVRALKRDRPGITQAEIDVNLAMVEATFGFGF